MTQYALVFPGQGSQSRGMMNGYADFPVVRETFAEASEVLKQDLWQLVAEGSDADLNATINTQPVMLTAGVAVYRAWQSLKAPAPMMMAGHSLGEYSALVASGALKFADALPLVRYRAECMQQAVPDGVGGIAAILGLDDDVVRAVCNEAAQNEVLEAVNYNSPGQIVIAGNRAAVERGMELAKARGAKRAGKRRRDAEGRGEGERRTAQRLDVKVRLPRVAHVERRRDRAGQGRHRSAGVVWAPEP